MTLNSASGYWQNIDQPTRLPGPPALPFVGSAFMIGNPNRFYSVMQDSRADSILEMDQATEGSRIRTGKKPIAARHHRAGGNSTGKFAQQTQRPQAG